MPTGYVGPGGQFVVVENTPQRADVVSTAAVSDALPSQVRTILATGQVVAGPCQISLIRCLTAGDITLRDSVVQTVAGTDTTSPSLFSATMAVGELARVPCQAAFGLHATVTGTFEVEF